MMGIGGFGLVQGGRVGGLLMLVGGRSTRMGGLLSFDTLGCTVMGKCVILILFCLC